MEQSNEKVVASGPRALAATVHPGDDVELAVLLEQTRVGLADPAGAGATIRRLAAGLREIRRRSTAERWDAVVVAARSHPLRVLVHQDPLTWRAYSKPRGYHGDAELLDVIHQRSHAAVCDAAEVSTLGQALFAYTVECKAPNAVRDRRVLLAKMIDEVADEVAQPHILSVACGHLREAESSRAVRDRSFGRFVGLDQDRGSLALVAKNLGPLGVEAVPGSVSVLLSGPFSEQRFDLIYAAGLYDYLDDRFAAHLTARMFAMLNPGGRLLIANYLPDIEDVGYMETYMGWKLVYRTTEELTALGRGIPEEERGAERAFQDQGRQVGYLELRRE